VATTAPWTCPTCRTHLSTRYCPACGESPPHTRDLTIRGFLREIVAGVTSIDGRLIRSFRCLLARPGELSVAFVEGRRKPYIAPFQLFLIANVAFFAVESLTGGTVLAAPLHSHLHQQDWSAFASSLVTHRLQQRGVALAAYAPVFDRAVVLNAKTLVALMVLPFALALPLVFYRSGRPFVGHVVFSLHLYAFVLLLFCVMMAVARIDQSIGGGGLRSRQVDVVLTTLVLIASAVYLYRASGRFYGSARALRGVRAVGLAFAMVAIAVGYRFLVFLITFYTT